MADAPTVMVVEDDDTLALGITHALETAGNLVVRHDNGESALATLAETKPDLVILDIMLPGMDGLQVLQQIRESLPTLPVIMLTAKNTESDRVDGLDAGADDYVTKPFSVRELLARVRARLRVAASPGTSDVITLGTTTVDLRKRLVQNGEQAERLTTHEAGVLSYLVEHISRDVTREALLEEVWGYSPNMQTRTVDNTILKLRKKVEADPKDPHHILTVHGVGYRLEP